MSNLIAVAGNVGVGKTTFTQRLCAAAGYAAALEDHSRRAFHTDLVASRHAALANQMDFLLLRADQERSIRRGSTVGVQDGGLDQDFYVFTRFLLHTGALEPREYELCRRLHEFARQLLPPPDLIIYLTAPLDVLVARRAARNRPAEVIAAADLPMIGDFVQEWIAAVDAPPVITVDATVDDPSFGTTIEALLPQIRQSLDRRAV